MFVGDNDQNGGVTNPSCGGEHSIDSGTKKSFYCSPGLLGRYVTIQIPGKDKSLQLCEVEVFSSLTRSTSTGISVLQVY